MLRYTVNFKKCSCIIAFIQLVKEKRLNEEAYIMLLSMLNT